MRYSKMGTYCVCWFTLTCTYNVYLMFPNMSSTLREQPCGHVHPAKIQISLRIRIVWSELSLGAFMIAKNASFLRKDTLIRLGGCASLFQYPFGAHVRGTLSFVAVQVFVNCTLCSQIMYTKTEVCRGYVILEGVGAREILLFYSFNFNQCVGAWRYVFGLARRGSTIGFHLLWHTVELAMNTRLCLL